MVDPDEKVHTLLGAQNSTPMPFQFAPIRPDRGILPLMLLLSCQQTGRTPIHSVDV